MLHLPYGGLMQKHYKQGSSLNQEIVEGVNILADNVSATLGPRGRTVALFHKETFC